mmetsp:Transcript_10812/g.12373  ORF Transcript_10812/g.12373 Transcript_10812/m.12373 type:complete len:118 (-) Transcript_10812:208-561(-)|eukprot:CAMPEP_0194147120 /NCGR_PEP_ID=MMETSP0152-20130528/22530_1 /TAXON_ID=1049557 /ORGANISM="Thalassiothrix antarctica, Strain L6-D1" /LENGTH=117 /DNA_ID=CAMNT_0038847813 /DNA_START=130 /DNA_END=483 /DNA_ORIENTATION=+
MRVIALLCTLCVASGFAPAPRGPVVSTLNMSDDSPNKGTVKWFDSEKGFGFIVPDDGTEDVFVHHSAVKADGFRSLAEGESVEFQTETDAQGRSKASGVTGPDGSNVQGAPNYDDGY